MRQVHANPKAKVLARARGTVLRRAWPHLVAGLLGLASPACVHVARGDVFHLATGGLVEGALLAEKDGHYQILTALGTVSVATDAVVQVETTPTPLHEYQQRAAAAADTPTDQAALGAWCAAHELAYLSRRHYRRALELDPDCAEARRALGFVRVGDFWVSGRRQPGRRAGVTSRPAGAGATGGPTEDPVKVARAIQGSWRRRIRAIKSMLLDSPLPHQVEEGRARILEIEDPLAIVPLSEVLSDGSLVCRTVLVEALRRFSDDAATVNLAALALADSHEDIRHAALRALVRRKDPRIAGQFREALDSNNDLLIRRAAEALGALGAREAVPALIPLLTARRVKEVEVPMGRYFSTLPAAFPVRYHWIGSTMVAVCPNIGVVSANPGFTVGPPFGVPRAQTVVKEVTVYRSEVREALRRLTGEDFGFDQAEWRRWYEEHRS